MSTNVQMIIDACCHLADDAIEAGYPEAHEDMCGVEVPPWLWEELDVEEKETGLICGWLPTAMAEHLNDVALASLQLQSVDGYTYRTEFFRAMTVKLKVPALKAMRESVGKKRD